MQDRARAVVWVESMSSVLVSVRLDAETYDSLCRYASAHHLTIEQAAAALIARPKLGAPRLNQHASKRPAQSVLDGYALRLARREINRKKLHEELGISASTCWRWIPAGQVKQLISLRLGAVPRL